MDADTINPTKNTADILDANTTSKLPIANTVYKEGCGLTAMCHILIIKPNTPATM